MIVLNGKMLKEEAEELSRYISRFGAFNHTRKTRSSLYEPVNGKNQVLRDEKRI